jgi:hypothetical protein
MRRKGRKGRTSYAEWEREDERDSILRFSA